MGWERRGNATYYYTKQRRGAKVVSIYHGRGELAELAVRLDDIRHSERVGELASPEMLVASATVADVHDLKQALARAAMLAAVERWREGFAGQAETTEEVGV
jgi:hypothetical protein